MAEGLLPVIIVTGFLGSGKTTLLRYWLGHPDFLRTVVIVNEYGTVGLDQRVLRQVEENTILLGGGCACCNVRSDLVCELKNIINARDTGELEVDRVVIETSGLADPAPILFSIMTDSVLRHHYKVQCVVSCLDSVNGKLHLTSGGESVKQIVVADRVILTKADMAKTEEMQELQDMVRAINPASVALESSFGEIEPDVVFAADTVRRSEAEVHRIAGMRPFHTAMVRSISIGFREPLNWAAFGIWLSALLYAHGESIYRVKGILDTGEAGPVLLNGVQHIIHPPQHLDDWGEEEHRSELVFIMRDIDPHTILESLRAFQHLIGARAEIREIDITPTNERNIK